MVLTAAGLTYTYVRIILHGVRGPRNEFIILKLFLKKIVFIFEKLALFPYAKKTSRVPLQGVQYLYLLSTLISNISLSSEFVGVSDLYVRGSGRANEGDYPSNEIVDLHLHQ